jgi:hypothetical protein
MIMFAHVMDTGARRSRGDDPPLAIPFDVMELLEEERGGR